MRGVHSIDEGAVDACGSGFAIVKDVGNVECLQSCRDFSRSFQAHLGL